MAKRKPASKQKGAPAKASKVERPFPRELLQEAIKIPLAIRENNGGNPWKPAEVANAVGRSPTTNAFFYLSAASRDFGLTVGTRDTAEISLTELGRKLAYAETPDEEKETRLEAFMGVDIFRKVLEYYKGSSLPEMKYLTNTLEAKFGLHPKVHDEFAQLFRQNCEYLQITEGVSESITAGSAATGQRDTTYATQDVITVAEPESESELVCFVAIPFTERHDDHKAGFFKEVLKQIIAPAGRKAGFRMITARKKGSDVIQATIVNNLLDADLVVVDLTEHNPNVLFELGVRMAEDKPVALIRAKGTAPIFDVDNMLRVEDYDPSLWPSTVEVDVPKIADHIRATWEERGSAQTFMKILRAKREQLNKSSK